MSAASGEAEGFYGRGGGVLRVGFDHWIRRRFGWPALTPCQSSDLRILGLIGGQPCPLHFPRPAWVDWVAAFALRMPRPRRAGGGPCVVTWQSVVAPHYAAPLVAALPVLPQCRFTGVSFPLWDHSPDRPQIRTLLTAGRSIRPTGPLRSGGIFRADAGGRRR